MFRVNNFDKLLDKATSNLRLDPDWPTILQICDLIRQNDCTPKYAIAGLKKKLYSQNPHQAMFALLVLESIVKNCGSGVHDEVASKAFCEMLRDLVKTTQHENLKTKVLELIQAWAFAFRNTPKYRAVQDTVNILKAEGHKFPPLKESDAMFSADTAPEWADGEVCHRCRVAFSLIVRRHHCRACGQVFCQQCSAKTSTLPKFGIEKEVRVCDACYDKVSRPPPANTKLDIVDTSNDYGPSTTQKKPPGKSAEELQEEEELQLALALSQSEAEHKAKERKTRSYIPPDPAPPSSSPTRSLVNASPDNSTSANAELSRYLDRTYWEQRLSRDVVSSAPPAPASQTSASPDVTADFAKPSTSTTQEEEAEDKELDDFVGTLRSQVEIFVNRMKSNSSRGRSIANDTSVQTLFMNITAMHSRLLRYIQQQDDKRVYLESLQDKVSQVRDSRAALDTLRAEHAARLAAEAEAAERQRQMQMAAKLQAMRKKKHEYLQYQRQLALQRVQEQEQEMQMRQEQQKHHYMLASGGNYYMPLPYQNSYMAQQNFPQNIAGQPQTSQADMQLNMNQMGNMSQSIPQLPQSYPMSTTSAGVNQMPVNIQAPMNLPAHTTIGQQNMMQSPMHMAQLQQLRMSMPVINQNLTNGMQLQQQNGQIQLPKQGMPNQPMQGMNPPVSQMQMGPQSMPTSISTNQVTGMPMQKIQLVQGTQGMQQQVPGSTLYSMAPQLPMQGQPLSMQGQQMMPGQMLVGQGGQQQSTSQGLPVHSQLTQSQLQSMHKPQGTAPQLQGLPPGQQQTGIPTQQQMPINQHNIHSNGQHMTAHQLINQQPIQGQTHLPGQPHIPGHPSMQVQPQIPGQPQMQGHPQMQGQPQLQGQQQIQGQPQMHAQPQMSNQPQIQGQQQIQGQIPPGQLPHQMQNPAQLYQQPQELPIQGTSMPQVVQQQQVKIPQQNIPSGSLQSAPSLQSQTQPAVKTESNNTTTELISFD